MTYSEAEKEFGQLVELERYDENEVMSWYAPKDTIGVILFSFDNGKNLFSVFGGRKNPLTKEQIEIFRKENPDLAKQYFANKK